jgi:hypothetical protein
MLDKISLIIPSFHSEDLTDISINSFERFRPHKLLINYVVVENSDDISYKQNILSLSKNITWVNNKTNLIGSDANAIGLEVGLKHVTTEWVFLAHCDVCVTSRLFFEEILRKAEEGFHVIGTEFDPSVHRIKALHISGIFLKTSIAKSVNLYPRFLKDGRHMDVGDEITSYCRENDIRHFCFRNTFNYPELADTLDPKYKIQTDRCVSDSGEVIFMHLGRGIPKTEKTYNKPDKTSLAEWTQFCKRIML